MCVLVPQSPRNIWLVVNTYIYIYTYYMCLYMLTIDTIVYIGSPCAVASQVKQIILRDPPIELVDHG